MKEIQKMIYYIPKMNHFNYLIMSMVVDSDDEEEMQEVESDLSIQLMEWNAPGNAPPEQSNWQDQQGHFKINSILQIHRLNYGKQ